MEGVLRWAKMPPVSGEHPFCLPRRFKRGCAAVQHDPADDGASVCGGIRENAQLLMQELSQRTQNRQACIMILCTIAVTFMTGVLVWLAKRIVSGAQQ